MSGSGSGNSEFTTYRSKELGFVINNPTNWETPQYDDTGFALKFTPSSNTFERLEIAQVELEKEDKGRTLEEIARGSELILGKTIKTIDASTQTNLDGSDAFKIVYTFEKRSLENIKVMAIYTIHDDALYSLKYLAKLDNYEEYLPLINEMINSFHFIST